MSRSPHPRRPPDERRSRSGLPKRRDGKREQSSFAPDRALSTTLDYTLSLAIASIVIMGLLVATGDFVGSQRESVVRTELRVIGERVVTDVTAADRLVDASSGSTTVVVNQSLPERITGLSYRITIAVDSGTNWVNLSTTTPDVSVSVRFDAATAVAERTVVGGDISVVYTGSQLEVRS